MPGLLSVVATPIGNLEDITLRALRILKEADVIACEDTRVTGQLLKYYEIEKPLLAVHQHTADGALEKICSRIQAGERVAYVSDAGTPGVNDPGGRWVTEVRLRAGDPDRAASLSLLITPAHPMTTTTERTTR
jgi:16S rRNA (cytidine1402-2'-O)-methyltransferase